MEDIGKNKVIWERFFTDSPQMTDSIVLGFLVESHPFRDGYCKKESHDESVQGAAGMYLASAPLLSEAPNFYEGWMTQPHNF